MSESHSTSLSSIDRSPCDAEGDIRLTEQLSSGGCDSLEVLSVGGGVRSAADLSSATRDILVRASQLPGLRVVLMPQAQLSEKDFDDLGMSNVVAADGIVPYEGSNIESLDPGAPRLIVDHHRGPRFAQESAALQLHRLVKEGKLSAFRSQSGEASLALLINHLDEDTAAAAYAAYEFVRGCRAAAVGRASRSAYRRVDEIMSTVSDMDVWMGASESVSELDQRRLKYVNEAWRIAGTTSSPTVIANALQASFRRWEELADGKRVTLPSLNRHLSLHVSSGPFAVVKHVTPEARTLLRKDPIRASFVLAFVGARNRRQFYSCLTFPGSPVRNKQQLLEELNGAETLRTEDPSLPVDEVVGAMRPTKAHYWGGNEAAGCAHTGSSFTLPEITTVLDEALRRQGIDAQLLASSRRDRRFDELELVEKRLER